MKQASLSAMRAAPFRVHRTKCRSIRESLWTRDPPAGRRYIPRVVVTDPLPRSAAAKKQYSASDAQLKMALPPAQELQEAARELEAALAAGDRPPVKRAGERI